MSDDAAWSGNYFNYFTEIEDRFRLARGTGLFLLSPLDWALIETWRTANIPLDAVLQGIDDAFTKWRSRKGRRQSVNSLAYCAQAVAEAAARLPQPGAVAPAQRNDLPFSPADLQRHLSEAAARLQSHQAVAMQEVAASLTRLADTAAEQMADLETLEQRLSALEDKLIGAVRASQSDDDLLAIRQSLQTELKPYRSKMTAAQLAVLERRYLETALFEKANLPRLSLFYLLQT